MTILNSTNDAWKPVAILNSGDYLSRYADVPKAELTKDDSVTIETLLRSIDGRLQTMDGRLDNMDKRLDKVSENIVELKVQTATIGARLTGVEERLDRAEDRFDRAEDRFDRQEKRQREADSQLIRFETQLERLPSWKSVGMTSASVTAGCCGLFVWLAEGGAKTLARFFE
jgi:archaellum component FlaC